MSTVTCWAGEAPAERIAPFSAPVQLRGYGTVSGHELTLRGPTGPASILAIACEGIASAQLVCAKYRSDLEVLPGAVRAELGAGRPIHEVAGRGVIAALRVGSAAHLVTAANRDDLAWLVRTRPELARAEWDPASTVPMYLDRWDRVGLRFYYWFWRTPSGVQPSAYDFGGDFDYGKAQGTGYVFWAGPSQMNTAEGLVNAPIWDWGPRAAASRGLPFGLNLSNGHGSESRWFANRYPHQLQQRMPQFSGSQHAIANPYMEAKGTLSWCGSEAYDASLGIMQDTLKRFAAMPNLVSILEPNGELHHGPQDILLEYGPLADADYRTHLEKTYGSLEALSRRWYGDAGRLRSWQDVRVPEVASFLGWNERSIDLTGEWAVGYEEMAPGSAAPAWDSHRFGYHPPVPTVPAPDAWLQPGFDDAQWPRITAPGTDRCMFIPHRPAIYRREVEVAAADGADAPRWLYVWDCNQAGGDEVRAVVNGTEVGRSPIVNGTPHWAAFPVSGILRAGTNQISLRLPDGYLAYRVYLSPDEPKQYPALGEQRNAQWVDLTRWTMATRMARVERSLGMIRQVDRDRQVTLMAPDHYADGVLQLAEEYGGEFKDTGFMGIGYYDLKAGMMQAAGLPFSVEPGSPARNLEEFRFMMGSYLTTNVQCVDYFIHEGDIRWNDDIRRDFEANRALYHLFGKFHAPRGDLAILYSTGSANLTDYPWGNDPNAGLRSGYFQWNIAAGLRGSYAYDNLTESGFRRGLADRYRVVLDSNSVIMDDSLVGEIEAWVRAGGVFITSGQTGRHTPTRRDAWPISRLSGYAVARIDAHAADGTPLESRLLSPVAGSALAGTWDGERANGLGLRRESPDCVDLLAWDDGTVAVGARRLGKGLVIHTGVKFGMATLPDRMEHARGIGRADELIALSELYGAILDAQGVPRIPTSCTVPSVHARRYVSNNGLHDVWVVWNGEKAPVTTDLILGDGFSPAAAVEVSSGQGVAVADGRIRGIELAPLQSRAYLTPRTTLAGAPREWFELQRSWWRGTKPPFAEKLPTTAEVQRCALDLGRDWAFRPLGDGDAAGPLVGATADDAAWQRLDLGIWSESGHHGVKRAVLRKTFTVPAAWKGGAVALWLHNHEYITFRDRGSMWLDGMPIVADTDGGVRGWSSPGLVAGSTHTIALEVRGAGSLVGVTGDCWLAWRPAPVATIDLAGGWSFTDDALRYGPAIRLPGKGEGLLARRTIRIDAAHADKQVLLRCVGNAEICGVMVNGRWIRQDHHPLAREWFVNVTPWIRFGADNEIHLGRIMQPGIFEVDSVGLDIYANGAAHP